MVDQQTTHHVDLRGTGVGRGSVAIQKLLSVDVVSPQKRVYSDTRVSSVYAPAALGEIGVLPGHMPLVSILLPGEIRISENEGKEIRFSIHSGFIQVKENRVLILAEEVEEMRD